MDMLDILLRELYKCVEKRKTIFITHTMQSYDVQVALIPTNIKYDKNGITISDSKDTYTIDDEKYDLSMDESGNCLSFSFRDKINKIYYTICF